MNQMNSEHTMTFDKPAITQLQELSVAMGLGYPNYVIKDKNFDTNQYEMVVSVGPHVGMGHGTTKKEAKRLAAESCISNMSVMNEVDPALIKEQAELSVRNYLADLKTDYSDDLHSLTQACHLGIPKYDLLGMKGPDNSLLFHYRVTVDRLGQSREGTGSSKDRAKQAAAEAMMKNILKEYSPYITKMDELQNMVLFDNITTHFGTSHVQTLINLCAFDKDCTIEYFYKDSWVYGCFAYKRMTVSNGMASGDTIVAKEQVASQIVEHLLLLSGDKQ